MHRYAKYYKEDGMEKRTLYKVFGIRLDILVNGKVRVDPLDPWDSSAVSSGRYQLCNTAPGPCGIRKTSVNAFLGCWPSHRNPWEILGKGREEENMFYRSHLSAVTWSVVLSKKLGDGSGGDLWKFKTFYWYFQKLNICILLFCLFLPPGREGFPYYVPTENIQSVYLCLAAWLWLVFLY